MKHLRMCMISTVSIYFQIHPFSCWGKDAHICFAKFKFCVYVFGSHLNTVQSENNQTMALLMQSRHAFLILSLNIFFYKKIKNFHHELTFNITLGFIESWDKVSWSMQPKKIRWECCLVLITVDFKFRSKKTSFSFVISIQKPMRSLLLINQSEMLEIVVCLKIRKE